MLFHPPHLDKKKATIRSIWVIRDVGFPEEKVLIDHNTDETLPIVLETACWAAHSIYPNTKMDEGRMAALVKKYGCERILINSAADWGISDLPKVPKTVQVMRAEGIAEEDIEKIVWHNPVAFFAQSGNLDVADIEIRPSINQTLMHDGNTVLRGQNPVVDS